MSCIIQNIIAIYREKCFEKCGFSRKFGKIAVHRRKREKSRFAAVNGKNRDIAHTTTNSSLWGPVNRGYTVLIMKTKFDKNKD